MGIRKTTENEQSAIKTIIHNFVELEYKIREAFNSDFEQDELSVLFSLGLANYIGNFIYLHSKADKKNRDKNFKSFIKSLENWKSEREKKDH